MFANCGNGCDRHMPKDGANLFEQRIWMTIKQKCTQPLIKNKQGHELRSLAHSFQLNYLQSLFIDISMKRCENHPDRIPMLVYNAARSVRMLCTKIFRMAGQAVLQSIIQKRSILLSNFLATLSSSISECLRVRTWGKARQGTTRQGFDDTLGLT